MTTQRRGLLIAGATAGILSLAAASYLQSIRSDAAQLYASTPIQIAPIPPELLPPGTGAPPEPKQLTNTQRSLLRAALWRDPLHQHLVNLIYIEAILQSGRTPKTQEIADILAKLGWRFTPSQQNLMISDALDARYSGVIDQADALMRRQKMTEQATTMLVTMEAIPQVHALIVQRLIGKPLWRTDYLLRFSPQSPPSILDARFRTMLALLRSPGGVTRAELAPTLRALVANGRGREAYTLWSQKMGASGNNILRDPRFSSATKNIGDNLDIPFEWTMGQGLGYSTDPGSDGATITWDGRGVPVFLTQSIPVTPNQSYKLSIEGHATSNNLSSLLKPALTCGSEIIPFTSTGTRNGIAYFRSADVPKDCNMAIMSIAGAVDAANEDVSITLSDIILQKAR